MMTKHVTGRVTNRSELRFVEAVEAAFSFLVEKFGFRLVGTEPPTLVRYESGTAFLNVYHGRQSYEINVEVGSIADPAGRSYRLADVLGAIVGLDDSRRTYFQASNREAVRRCVQQIADLVAKHYGPVVRGEADVFDRVAAHTSENSEAYTREVVQRPVREAAEKAWHTKDYAKVQELYASIQDNLTLVEQKRLEYAERHCRRRV